jgi:hypothetical protein
MKKEHYDFTAIKGEQKTVLNKYRCVHCGKVVERESVLK